MPPITESSPADAESPFLPLDEGPRVIVYHQTHVHHDRPISILPLLQQRGSLTHLIVAAVHLNDDNTLTLNDDPHTSPRTAHLWTEVTLAQQRGIKVLALLGGAAKGTYARLDTGLTDPTTPGKPVLDQTAFERNYAPLHDFLTTRKLDGIDLDVEEDMTLNGIIHLIDRLRDDFGRHFLITLAPVATALIRGHRHLSGFDYFALERLRGAQIDWYNTQFYCGWGNASNLRAYETILYQGWSPAKVVMGLSTNPCTNGYVPIERMRDVMNVLRIVEPEFAGVFGWEYFNSLPGGEERPWEWCRVMAREIRAIEPRLSLLEMPGREHEFMEIRPDISQPIMPGRFPS